MSYHRERFVKPHRIDIRTIRHANGEPFNSIMAVVGSLLPEQRLHLIAPFRPEPLLKLLGGKGFDNETTCDSDGLWHVLFTPRPRTKTIIEPSDPLTWPTATVLVDLLETAAGKTTDVVLGRLQDLRRHEVMFALLAEEPSDLPFRLLDEGHLCFGRWAEETYRLMVLVSGAVGPEG
jgi:uncharacterized protein (DUF2249 family)